MQIQESGSKNPGQNINQKLQKKCLLSKPKSELLRKREIMKISLFLDGSSSLSIKISEKIDKKFENSNLLKKFSKLRKKNLDRDPFFPSVDRGSASN